MKATEVRKKLPPLTEEQERRLQEGAAKKLADAKAFLATVDLEQLKQVMNGKR